MDFKAIKEGKFGYSLTVVTQSGNKFEGTLVNYYDNDSALYLKTKDGLIIINSDCIESIY